MALLLDAILWGLAILGGIGAVVSIWVASQPDCDIEGIKGHYDYAKGTKEEEWSIKVRLGSIPYLRTRLLRKRLLCSIPSTHVNVVPHVLRGSEMEEIDSDDESFEYSFSEKKDHLQIYVKKDFVAGLKMHTTIMFRIVQPISKAEMRSLVKPSDFQVAKSGATVARVRLENTAKFEIRNFEFVYLLPKVKTVNKVDAFKVNNTRLPLAYNLSDFALRHEDSMGGGSFPSPGGQTGSDSLVGIITLEPGATEVIIEYT